MLLILSPAIGELIQQPNIYYRMNGGILIAVLALAIVLGLAWWRAAARRREPANQFAVPI
jgi:membrane protein DedA with SNARE-associated domain